MRFVIHAGGGQVILEVHCSYLRWRQCLADGGEDERKANDERNIKKCWSDDNSMKKNKLKEWLTGQLKLGGHKVWRTRKPNPSNTPAASSLLSTAQHFTKQTSIVRSWRATCRTYVHWACCKDTASGKLLYLSFVTLPNKGATAALCVYAKLAAWWLSHTTVKMGWNWKIGGLMVTGDWLQIGDHLQSQGDVGWDKKLLS